MHAEGQGVEFDAALGASYVLEELIGRGATGEVWRAVDRRTGESVAAKVLRSEHVADRDLVGRFVRERSILTGLRHPGVVTVRDLVVEGERLAIVMDLVEGGSLREVLDDGPLAPVLALEVTVAVLDGLAAAHEHGVLHRDIKPDNVLLATDWRDVRPGAVRLTDFGISRIVAEGAGSTTGLLGTPEYMSPELLTTGAADLPADVYGLGVLLYELLAGRTPFAGPGTDYTVAHRHVTTEPPRLPVPDPLWGALAQLLDKDPRQRPTAARAAARVRQLRTDPSVADLAPLVVEPPERFDPLARPATMVRGLRVQEAAPASPEPAGDAAVVDDVDLGASSQQTTVRPMRVPVARERTAPVSVPGPTPARTPPWREPRVLALVGAALALLLLAVGVTIWTGSDDDSPAGGGGGPAPTASLQDQPKPTGLGIDRSATYDVERGEVGLSVSYGAQRAPLEGPFLEVLPGIEQGDGCPAVTWQGAQARANLPTSTGITTPCGWSVDPGTLEPGATVTVQATVRVELSVEAGADPTAALQEWLTSAAAATTAATADDAVVSTSYAAQRLTGIEVVAPDRTVSPRTLQLSLLPVWASGPDQLNPIYRSPSVGQPSTLLQSLAGGEEGVRFSDGCGGALAVSADGLVVTALRPAEECAVNAQVGNFTDLVSNTFAIITRGS